MDERLKGTVERMRKGNYRMRVTVDYNEHGNPIRLSKYAEAKNERRAYIELEKWIDDLEEHGYQDLSNMTFGKFYNEIWKKAALDLLEPRTYSDYKDIIDRRFYKKLKNKKLSEIKPFEVRKIIEEAKSMKNDEESLSRSTKKKYLHVISSVLNLAMDEYRIIKSNPAAQIHLKKVKGEKKKVKEPYSLSEIDALFKALNKPTTDLKTRALVYTAFVTGARLAEITALEDDDIDFINKKIRFHQRIISDSITGKQVWKRVDGLKSDDEKTLSVPDDYLKIMKEFINKIQKEREKLNVVPEHKYTFGEADGAFQIPQTLSRRWTKFTKDENLRHIRFHDIRHTTASFLIANPSIPIKVVQERLGHKNYQTTMNMYASALEESDRKASDIFGLALSTKSSGLKN